MPSVPEQPLLSGNVSQLHRKKKGLQTAETWPWSRRQGLLSIFPAAHFLKAFANKEFANLVLLRTVMLLGVSEI